MVRVEDQWALPAGPQWTSSCGHANCRGECAESCSEFFWLLPRECKNLYIN